MINKKIKIYKSLLYEIEGSLGIDESERTYASSNTIQNIESKKTTSASDSVKNLPNIPKKGILKSSNTPSTIEKKLIAKQITEEEQDIIDSAKNGSKILETMTKEEYLEAIKK